MIQVKIDDVNIIYSSIFAVRFNILSLNSFLFFKDDTHPRIIQPLGKNDTCVLTPQVHTRHAVTKSSGSLNVIGTPGPTRSSPVPIQRQQQQRRTRKLSITTPNWAVRVFSQALKWAKENPTDESDVRVLRKLHNRCLISLNNVHKLKREPQHA